VNIDQNLAPDKALAAVVGRYDVLDLLACVGALLLVPENAERELRLDQLGRIAASLETTEGKPRVSLSALRNICNSGPLAALASQEDPAENLFTESLTFFGGSHIVFPGITEHGCYVLNQLCRAIFLRGDSLSRSQFGRKAYHLLMAAFLISDAVASRAGLRRGLVPARGPGRKVVVPPSPKMNELKHSVVFHDHEILQILRQKRIPREALDPLTLECGSREPGQFGDVERSELGLRPMVRVHDQLIVVEPTSIVFAAQQAVVRLAQEFGQTDALAKAFCDSVWIDVVESLGFLENHLVPISLPDQAPAACVRQAFFNIDTDKLLYVTLLTDDLNNYDPNAEWAVQGMTGELQERVRKAEQTAMELKAPVNEVLNLLLFQPIGRSFFMGIAGPSDPLRSPRLAMSASELRVIAEIGGGDQLLLWKYAKAGDAVRQVTHVFRFSELDEFSLWRGRGCSYHVSDEGIPTMLSITPGTGANLQFDRQGKRDWHAVQSFEEGRLAEVTCLHDSPQVPIYVSPAHIDRFVAFYVASFTIPVWIVAEREQSETAELRRFETIVCEMIAFWLWQFSSTIDQAVASLATLGRPLIIRVKLIDPVGWASGEYGEAADIDEEVNATAFLTGCSVEVQCGPGFRNTLSGPDNGGEREFMRRLLRALRDLIEEAGRHRAEELTELRIETLLNRVAPLGQKKMVIVSDLRLDPDLDRHDIPDWREVQEADVSALRDDIGRAIAAGPLAGQEKLDGDVAAKQVVDFLYKELRKLAASVQRDSLLDELIGMNEALLAHGASLNLTIPTRVACYGDLSDIVDDIIKEQTRLNAALVASRFAIEYAAAKPGDGPRPMSLSVYDRLLALAEQIVQWGFVDDLAHFRLADIEVEVTGSGRLAVDAGGYTETRESYLRQAFFPSHIKQATESFDKRWRERGTVDEDFLKEVNSVTAAEFGLPLADIITFLVETRSVGYELPGPTKVMPQDRFVATLGDRLGWQKAEVERAIDLLALRPRSDYLSPPEPYERDDVYPWKFNRRLAYVRRPLILRCRKGAWEIAWGNRHLHLAGQHLVNVCLNGRLKPRSSEMKAFIGRSLNEAGQEFNDRVADLFSGRSGIVVKRRVKKIRGEIIGGGGTPLGDVDVLVGDVKRREILLIECKNLALARTPRELANEVQELFEGKHGRRSASERQIKRAEWVRGRLSGLLMDLGLSQKRSWKVKPMIVVDAEPLSSWLRRSPVPVFSFRALREQLQGSLR